MESNTLALSYSNNIPEPTHAVFTELWVGCNGICLVLTFERTPHRRMRQLSLVIVSATCNFKIKLVITKFQKGEKLKAPLKNDLTKININKMDIARNRRNISFLWNQSAKGRNQILFMNSVWIVSIDVIGAFWQWKENYTELSESCPTDKWKISWAAMLVAKRSCLPNF